MAYAMNSTHTTGRTGPTVRQVAMSTSATSSIPHTTSMTNGAKPREM